MNALRFPKAIALLCVGLACGPSEPPAAPQPTARPLLWRIEVEPPSYLYGTIHLPDPRVTALPASVERAFESSDVFYSEVPLDKLSQARMVTSLLLPAGQTLSELLPRSLYDRTVRYATERGFPAVALERQKILTVSVLIPLLDHLAVWGNQPALDLSLYQLASARGAELGALETIDEQVGILDSISLEAQRHMLAATLDALEALEPGQLHPVEALLRSYLAGDEDALLRQAFRDVDPEDPHAAQFIEIAIDGRNHTMAKRIAEHLAAEPQRSHFFAVGALHLPGSEGIVALLAERGFVLERVGAAGESKGALPTSAGR